MRSFNIIAPKFVEMLNNHLSYELAHEMGLIAPHSEMVFYRVNGNYRGIHLLVEQLEELTLRKNKKMPGDVYSGEMVGKDYIQGINVEVFKNYGIWGKVAANNHFNIDSKLPLKALIDELTKFTEGKPNRFFEMIDIDMWARFSAFEALVQTFHYDKGHNWRLYYDPAKGVFQPIVWDPIGWASFSYNIKRKDDVIITMVDKALYSNYKFIKARQTFLKEFFSQKRDVIFLDNVRSQMNKIQETTHTDPYIVSHFVHYTAKDCNKTMEKMFHFIKNTFNELKEHHLLINDKVKYKKINNKKIVLSVSGRAPIESVEFLYSNPVEFKQKGYVLFWQNGIKKKVDVSGAMSIKGRRIQLNMHLMAIHEQYQESDDQLRGWALKIKPSYFEIQFENIEGNEKSLQENVLLNIKIKRNEYEDSKLSTNIEQTQFGAGFEIVNPQPKDKPLIWSGNILIKENQTISTPLIINPGTKIILAPDCSVFIKGKVLAVGTPEQPIEFIGEQKKPWGTIALQGKKTSGSMFKYCRFSDGSGYKIALTEYSAMLSIHDAQNIVLDSVSFNQSHVVDDMVHAVYSSLYFKNCSFKSALFDALDLDICEATIEGCRFENNGNDGLDLMTSNVKVTNSVFIGNRDKGISVGEGSNLQLFNSQFENNKIGIQAKDNSKAIVFNSNFVAQNKAVDAYKKKLAVWYWWLYFYSKVSL